MRDSIVTFLTMIACFLLIIFLAVSTAEHRPGLEWMRGTVGNGSCCGVSDCAQVPVMVLARDGDVMAALVNGHEVIVPASWVHVSGDSHTYWCYVPDHSQGMSENDRGEVVWQMPARPSRDNTRCLFVMPLG